KLKDQVASGCPCKSGVRAASVVSLHFGTPCRSLIGAAPKDHERLRNVISALPIGQDKVTVLRLYDCRGGVVVAVAFDHLTVLHLEEWWGWRRRRVRRTG